MNNTPYVAVICTAERLQLRDDVGQTICFNLSLSTAVVQAGAVDADVWTFIHNNRNLLEMWKQTFATDSTGNLLFDVFDVGPTSPTTVTALGAVGKAVPPTSRSAPCELTLSDELDSLLGGGDLNPLLWDPLNPAPETIASPANAQAVKTSVYQPNPWRNTVAHASTWPRPVAQQLCLSFEVHLPANLVANADSVLIFPRFAGGEAVLHVSSLLDGSPWQSYGGEYSLPTSPPTPRPRWAYQTPCAVATQSADGLVDMSSYWIDRDPEAAVHSTSDWRQTLEATTANRFDYIPRLLAVVEENFQLNQPAPTSDSNSVWALGIQMLKDLSDFGARMALEGSSLQYAFLLRAIEDVHGYPAPNGDQSATDLVKLLSAQPGDWRNQVWKMLQGVDATLASYFGPLSSPAQSPAAKDVIPTLRRLYSALSKDQNLATLLLNWWSDSFGSPGPSDWPDIYQSLAGTVFPTAHLHKCYLSAVAGNSSPSIRAALGTPFPGRTGHTATLIESRGQMLVFAGASAGGTLLNDVWTMGVAGGSAQPWSQLAPSGNLPVPRKGHAAVFDVASSQLFVFGGLANNAYGNELWSLAIPGKGNPAWTKVTTARTPAARSGHSAVYDPAAPVSPPGSPPASPPARPSSMIVFGGDTGTPLAPSPANDAWVLEIVPSGAPVWSPVQISGGAPPPARIFHSAVYDSLSNRMIVFGGTTGNALVANDVWILTDANGSGGGRHGFSIRPPEVPRQGRITRLSTTPAPIA